MFGMPVQISITRGQVFLTLQYILVTILTTGCTYALVYAHFVYLYCPISLLHACVSHVFFNTCMRAREGVGSRVLFSLSMVDACCWRGGLSFGMDKIGVFLYFCGWWGGGWVCAYIRAGVYVRNFFVNISVHICFTLATRCA